MEEVSVGGKPSTSVTAMGGRLTDSLWYSMRWKTIFTIWVRLAFAVVWFTSLLESRKML